MVSSKNAQPYKAANNGVKKLANEINVAVCVLSRCPYILWQIILLIKITAMSNRANEPGSRIYHAPVVNRDVAKANAPPIVMHMPFIMAGA